MIMRWAVMVEAISKSKFWKESAIFVLEDDAQMGQIMLMRIVQLV